MSPLVCQFKCVLKRFQNSQNPRCLSYEYLSPWLPSTNNHMPQDNWSPSPPHIVPLITSCDDYFIFILYSWPSLFFCKLHIKCIFQHCVLTWNHLAINPAAWYEYSINWSTDFEIRKLNLNLISILIIWENLGKLSLFIFIKIGSEFLAFKSCFVKLNTVWKALSRVPGI